MCVCVCRFVCIFESYCPLMMKDTKYMRKKLVSSFYPPPHTEHTSKEKMKIQMESCTVEEVSIRDVLFFRDISPIPVISEFLFRPIALLLPNFTCTLTHTWAPRSTLPSSLHSTHITIGKLSSNCPFSRPGDPWRQGVNCI